MPKADYAYSLQRLFELLRLIPKPPAQRTISELQEALSESLGEPVDKRWMERSLRMLREQFESPRESWRLVGLSYASWAA